MNAAGESASVWVFNGVVQGWCNAGVQCLIKSDENTYKNIAF
jgi:hypothetical protein